MDPFRSAVYSIAKRFTGGDKSLEYYLSGDVPYVQSRSNPNAVELPIHKDPARLSKAAYEEAISRIGGDPISFITQFDPSEEHHNVTPSTDTNLSAELIRAFTRPITDQATFGHLTGTIGQDDQGPYLQLYDRYDFGPQFRDMYSGKYPDWALSLGSRLLDELGTPYELQSRIRLEQGD